MKRIFLALMALVAMASAAQAVPILDFNIDASHPATASVSYDGVGGPLVGVDISVDSVLGITTPANSGVSLPITGGILSFTTGAFTGSDASNWFFGGGGTITITGDAGFGAATLLSGTFTEAQVTAVGSTFRVAIAAFLDTKDDDLAGFYGIAPGLPWAGSFNLSFMATGAPPGGFSSSIVLSGDVVNSPVPEPGSVILLGGCFAGLAGAGMFRRRKAVPSVS